MAMGPRCFRCFIFILSGPVELLFLDALIAKITCSVVISMREDFSFFVFLSVFLFSFFVVYFIGLVNCLLKAVAICFGVMQVSFPKLIVLFRSCFGFLLERF